MNRRRFLQGAGMVTGGLLLVPGQLIAGDSQEVSADRNYHAAVQNFLQSVAEDLNVPYENLERWAAKNRPDCFAGASTGPLQKKRYYRGLPCIRGASTRILPSFVSL